WEGRSAFRWDSLNYMLPARQPKASWTGMPSTRWYGHGYLQGRGRNGPSFRWNIHLDTDSTTVTLRFAVPSTRPFWTTVISCHGTRLFTFPTTSGLNLMIVVFCRRLLRRSCISPALRRGYMYLANAPQPIHS